MADGTARPAVVTTPLDGAASAGQQTGEAEWGRRLEHHW
jgi:hypothetical protein